VPDRRPRVLIEEWLPIEELGIESRRENSTGLHPPPNRLHVWWARRPLTVSRAAVLASLLPAYSEDWPEELRRRFPNEESYRQWFVRLLGIRGDPIASKRLAAYARERGVHLPANPFDYPRAFTVVADETQLALMLGLLDEVWSGKDVSVADPMAGGGSIPFEALRFGLSTYANELNPVASIVLQATLDFPARYGVGLIEHIKRFGLQVDRRVSSHLLRFYPMEPGERVRQYMWARTVACPATGKPVPLSPNWWLHKPKDSPVDQWVGVRLIAEPQAKGCRFEIVRGRQCQAAHPEVGTIKRGVARSPWTGDPIDGDYIKKEAQAGRMGQQLYALGIQTARGRDFRAPTEADMAAAEAAAQELAARFPRWEREGIIPVLEVPKGNKTSEPLRYGIYRWCDMFSTRQLLALGTCIEAFREVEEDTRRELPPDRARAVLTYLALAVDKCADYNSRMIRWHSTRDVIAGTFDRHDFSFKWSHAEFDAAHNLLPWTVDQVVDAYAGMARLVESANLPLFSGDGPRVVDRLTVENRNAASLPSLPSGSVHLVCVDPPYYDNVMYAELSNFFYVWQKRTIGHLYPEWFKTQLVEPDEEAVANPARFAALGGKKKKLAEEDYQRKMAACFREMHRILRDDGVLTVMFTHKRVDAWDSLGTALIEAGFTIEASWPVHTESEHSLHQAKKNAAASTILLVCRKRQSSGDPSTGSPSTGSGRAGDSEVSGEGPVWWEDIRGRVRQVAREKAAEFEKMGIRGVDLYISTFGPVLSIISERWPVLTSELDERTGDPRPLRPEVALDLARAEVLALRKQGLLQGRTVQFDPLTDWYLMAWDAFKAVEFPADEARKLALAVGIDLERDLVAQRVIAKKQSTVVLQEPVARRRKGHVDPDLDTFPSWLDAVHTAMMVYQEDGEHACRRFLNGAGLAADSTFKAALQAVINAIPRTREKGKFVRPETEVLENMRLTFFRDIEAPPEEPEPDLAALQPRLPRFEEGEEEAGEELEEQEEEDGEVE
jgi:adenine-specific DNA methylase